MSTEASFDWSPVGEKFWREASAACTHKPTEQQLRFAVGKQNGLTAKDAAQRAGYEAADNEGIRNAGSRALKSTAVQELLAYAYAETGTGDDGIIRDGEPKRILTRIARTGDNTARIKSLEALNKIEEQDRQRGQRSRDAAGDSAHSAQALLYEIGLMAAPLLCEVHFAMGGDATTAPHFFAFAPFIARRFPEQWAKYREPLLARATCFKGSEVEQRQLEAFDAAGAAPEPTDAEFRCAIGAVVVHHRSNGAAPISVDQEVSDASA